MSSPVELQNRPKLRGPALVAAIVALVVWAAFVVLLLFWADSATELAWTRYAFLLASVEAVAFAAGGALWGASIQRERAEKAEQRADENAADASNGRALATAVYTDASPQGERQPGVQAFGAADSEVARRHAQLAKSLFPNL